MGNNDVAYLALIAILLAYIASDKSPAAPEGFAERERPRRPQTAPRPFLLPRAHVGSLAPEAYVERLGREAARAMGGTPASDPTSGRQRLLHASLAFEAGGTDVNDIDSVAVAEEGGKGFVSGRGLGV